MSATAPHSGISIRRENADDFPLIRELVKTAFQTAEVADGDEQDFVDRQRESNSYIPELALIAEQDDTPAGYIMLTRTRVIDTSRSFEVLLLAAVAVLPAYRRRGVGAELIRTGLRLAEDRGYRAVLLAGDPAYYRRFGFTPSADYGIVNSNGIADENVMARELVPGALKEIEGIIRLF